MMHSLSRAITVLLLAGFLTQCTGVSDDVETPDVQTAVIGAEESQDMLAAWADADRLRPSALLGVFIADYLSYTAVYQSALAGVEAQMEILFNDDRIEDETYALLETLGSILQVDVNDMLNRSNGRARAFETYVQNLAELGTTATAKKQGLEQEMDEIQTARRDQRRDTAKLQSDLNSALREQDYASASGLQRQLIDAETALAKLESEEDEQRSVIRLFEDLLEIADERLNAMQTNREALIAGVKVIEVPGVDDLGLLEKGRYRRRNSTFESILGE